MKNKSYIGISFIILLFGIYAIPKIITRIKNGDVVKGSSLDNVSNANKNSDLSLIGPIPKFELTNQDGKKMSNTDYLGKVYVVEFFFTSCATICPKMNKNMLQVQNKFFGNPNFGIASISINPEYDTSEILKTYAKNIGATSKNWHFLTGDKKYIMDLSYKGFNLYAGENSKVPGGFEHSGFFALIDKKGNIRCRNDDYNNPTVYYDGIEQDGIKALMQDITQLLEE